MQQKRLDRSNDGKERITRMVIGGAGGRAGGVACGSVKDTETVTVKRPSVSVRS